MQLLQSNWQNEEWSIGQMLISVSTSRQFIDDTSMESISSPGYTGNIMIEKFKACVSFNLLDMHK